MDFEVKILDYSCLCGNRSGWKSEYYLHWNCRSFPGRPPALANAFRMLVEIPWCRRRLYCKVHLIFVICDLHQTPYHIPHLTTTLSTRADGGSRPTRYTPGNTTPDR
jgi:hypothetical protein